MFPRRDIGQKMCGKPPTRHASPDGGSDPIVLEPADESICKHSEEKGFLLPGNAGKTRKKDYDPTRKKKEKKERVWTVQLKRPKNLKPMHQHVRM